MTFTLFTNNILKSIYHNIKHIYNIPNINLYERMYFMFLSIISVISYSSGVNKNNNFRVVKDKEYTVYNMNESKNNNIVVIPTLVVSLTCKAVSAASDKTTLAARLASPAAALADTTLMLELSCVKVTKSLAAAIEVLRSDTATFLVVSLPTSTIGNTSLSARSTADRATSSVILTLAIVIPLHKS